MDGPANHAAELRGEAPTGAPSPGALGSETKQKSSSIFGELTNTLGAIRRVISDFLDLATLEARRAGITLMWMVACGSIAAILAVTIVIILDYEYPRLGVIRIDPVDQVLAGLRKSMK